MTRWLPFTMAIVPPRSLPTRPMCVNIHRGWRPVLEGTAPPHALVSFGAGAGPDLRPPLVPTCSPDVVLPPSDSPHNEVVEEASFAFVPNLVEFKGEEARRDSLARYKWPEHVVQVLKSRTATVHLSEGEGTWCRAWKCGLPASPASTAGFAVSASRWSHENKVAFRLNCHSLKTVSRMGGSSD